MTKFSLRALLRQSLRYAFSVRIKYASFTLLDFSLNRIKGENFV